MTSATIKLQSEFIEVVEKIAKDTPILHSTEWLKSNS